MDKKESRRKTNELEISKTTTADPAGSGKIASAAAASDGSAKNAVPVGPDSLAATAASAGAAPNGKSTSKTKMATKGGNATSAKPSSTKTKAKTVTKSPVDDRIDRIETFMAESRKENNEIRGMLETLLLARTTSELEPKYNARSRVRGQADPSRDVAEAYAYGDGDYGEEFYDEQMQSDTYSESEAEYKDHDGQSINATGDCNIRVVSDTDDNEAAGPDTLLSPSTAEAAPQDKEKMGFAKRFATTTEEGTPLHESQTQSVNFLLTNALEEKYMAEICQKYPKPSNCQNLLVPKVNPLIWENLSPHVRNLDLKIQRCQKPLIRGLVALLKATNDSPKLSVEQEDSVALLASAHFELNQLRKELIKPDLNNRYTHLCKPRVKTTEWLFGDDLHKAVKELDEEQKTVGVMRSRQGRHSHRGRRFTPYQSLIQGASARPQHHHSQPLPECRLDSRP